MTTLAILTGALINYVLFIHNHKILKQLYFKNGLYSSRLAHAKYFSTYAEYVFKHTLDKEEWNKPFENIHLYQQKR